MLTMIYRIAVLNDDPGRDGPAGRFERYLQGVELDYYRINSDGVIERMARNSPGDEWYWRDAPKTYQVEWGAKNKAGKEVFVNDVIEYVGTKVLTWIEDLEYLMWLLMNVPASDYKVIGDINTNPMLLQKLK